MSNEKYLKAKIKPYNGKINTNFNNNKKQIERSQFICLSVNLIDSVFRFSGLISAERNQVFTMLTKSSFAAIIMQQ